jgi:hypothetical protein
MQLLPVGVVGLKWYNMHNERWLEALHEDGPGGHVSSATHPDDPSTVYAQGGGLGWGGRGSSRRHVQAQQIDIQFQERQSKIMKEWDGKCLAKTVGFGRRFSNATHNIMVNLAPVA